MFPESNGPSFWTVLEIQARLIGERTCTSAFFDTYDEAIANYFQKCAAAAGSIYDYDAVFVLQSNGRITDSHIFDRRR